MGRATLLAPGDTKMNHGAGRGDFEVRPLFQQAASRDLCASGRTHLDAHFPTGTLVEAVDDGGPIAGLIHSYVFRLLS